MGFGDAIILNLLGHAVILMLIIGGIIGYIWCDIVRAIIKAIKTRGN